MMTLVRRPSPFGEPWKGTGLDRRIRIAPSKGQSNRTSTSDAAGAEHAGA
jgi:hypothetical protein